VAVVDSLTGTVTGVAGGTTVILLTAPGASGPVLDSALIVVPVNGQAVAFATANGSSYGAAKVGDTVRVLVGVDIRAVTGEELGGYGAQMNWDPAVMQYVSTEAVPTVGFTAPLSDETNAGSGQLLFSASDALGKSGPVIGLAYVKFVALSADPTTPLTLALSGLTTANSVNLLPGARVVSGSIQVK
jgi:hypothetical protein